MLTATVRGHAAEGDLPVIVATPESHPYAYREEGITKGALYDLVVEAFRRAHKVVEIRFFPWARCMQEVRAGRADAMFVLYKTPERERDFAYPEEPLTQLRERIFVRRYANFELLDDFANFRGRRIGMLNYTAHGDRLTEAIGKKEISARFSASSYESLVDMLASGHLDLVIGVDDAIIDTVFSQGLQARIREIDPVVDTLPAYLVFSRRPALAEVSHDFDRALRSMKEDGTYDRIVADYPRKALNAGENP